MMTGAEFGEKSLVLPEFRALSSPWVRIAFNLDDSSGQFWLRRDEIRAMFHGMSLMFATHLTNIGPRAVRSLCCIRLLRML